MLHPADVTPMQVNPATIPVDDRRRAHQMRYDAQTAADSARTRVVEALTANGTPADTAETLADELIITTRAADALRLEYARNAVLDFEHRRYWSGIDDLNGAVDFLYRSTHAYPVRTAHDR